MRFRALATDYDGTIAHHGVVGPSTVAALRRCAQSGRKLVLVTGREIKDLLPVFPDLALFDIVVAENGGVLYTPKTGAERLLAAPPVPEFVERLKSRGVGSLSVGRTIVATWEPFEVIVLDVIRELGLELQVTFNKGAVMVLPSGVNKRSGLEAAIDELGLSLHNCVAVGDAENDHAFLSACECSVAVANALPAVKATADYATTADHGAGVEELIDRLLRDDLVSLEPSLVRHHVVLGRRDDGSEVTIPPHRSVIMVAGSSGGGKSTAATGLLERLVDKNYQLCVIDPEGDYEGFESAIVAGTADTGPEPDQVMQILERAQSNAIVTLLGVPLQDRPRVFVSVMSRIQELRAHQGRPHWLVVDEAHHVLGADYDPAPIALPQSLGSLLFITVNPSTVHQALLQSVGVAIAVGKDALSTLMEFASALGRPAPLARVVPEEPGQVLMWRPGEVEATRLSMPPGRSSRERHRKKYARGELGPDRSFYFRGPENRLNLKAQNLIVFNSIAEGVDDDTWLHHLRAGDYSKWMATSVKDEALAFEVQEVENDPQLAPDVSRQRVRALIEARYTLPA